MCLVLCPKLILIDALQKMCTNWKESRANQQILSDNLENVIYKERLSLFKLFSTMKEKTESLFRVAIL